MADKMKGNTVAEEVLRLIGDRHARKLARLYWDLEELAAQKNAPPGIHGLAANLLEVYELESFADLPGLD
jgi:hypothetical protein